MYKIYFKQAVEMLKQNKFFSTISILGTALAIMMIMVILVTDSMKNVSVAPEIYRDRMLYITNEVKKDTTDGGRGSSSGSVSYAALRYLSDIKNVESITAWMGPSSVLAGLEGDTDMESMKILSADYSYWKILAFSFIEGRTFTEEEFQSGVCNIIISESTSKKLFKGEQAIGQSLLINFEPYTVIGVVKDVSPIFHCAYSDIWRPYTSISNYQNIGGYEVAILTHTIKDLPAIREEIRIAEKKFSDMETPWTIYLNGPQTHEARRIGVWAYSEDEMMEKIKIQGRKTGFILIVILLIPAINLSGLNLSRIRRRTPEIGVRKAFGAKKHIILTQILFENLITSFIGGIIGLLLSVLVIFQMKEWLLGISEESIIPFNTIISIPVALSVVGVCILVNLISTAIPAYRASQLTIVNSLTNNEKLS